MLGFEASCEAEPASWLEDDDEDEEGEEDELCALPPAVPERPDEPFCPFREALCPGWSRTTDEKGAPAR